MKPKLLDGVKFGGGKVGTIVEVFDEGKAFMVEITDGEGRTVDLPIVQPEDIEEIIFTA